MKNVDQQLRLAVLDAFDAGTEAQRLTLPLAIRQPRLRWTDLLITLGLQKPTTDRAERSSRKLRSETASLACARFTSALETLIGLLPDEPLIEAARPSPTWKARVEEADSREQVAAIRSELGAALAEIADLKSQVIRNRRLTPRAG